MKVVKINPLHYKKTPCCDCGIYHVEHRLVFQFVEKKVALCSECFKKIFESTALHRKGNE